MRSKKAIINISTTILMNTISIIIGFIVPKLLIETYGSNVNGLVNSITQFLGYIALLEAGIGPIVISSLYKPIADGNKEDIESILSSAQSFFRKISYFFLLYLFFLLMIYPSFVSDNFNSIYSISLILIISLSTFFEYYFGIIYRLFLESSQKKYIINIINIFTTLLNAILIIILIKNNFSIHIVKLLSTIAFIIRPLFLNFYVKKKYNFTINNNVKKFNLKNRREGLSLHIAGIIFSKADVIVLTIFSTMKNVSIYSVYNLVVTGVNNLVISFSGGVGAAFGDMIAKNEQTNLEKKFRHYETFYLLIISIIISCMLCLFIPFIKIYTINISDANYVNKLFSILLCIGSFFYLVKVPYESLCYAGGFFKDIKNGGWIEAFLNLIISLLLAFKLELLGVAIGTAISVFFRMTELIIFSNKNILKNDFILSVKKILISIITILLIVLIFNFYIKKIIMINNFIIFLICAITMLLLSFIISIIIFSIFYKDDIIYIKSIILRRDNK